MTTSALAVSSKREEPLCVGNGAALDEIDSFRRNIAPQQLTEHDLSQVDMRPRAWNPMDDLIRPGNAGELIGHVIADLEGVDRNVRTNRGDDSADVPTLLLHPLEGRPDDAGSNAPPAGMDRCDDSARGVREQDWNTVSDPDSACMRSWSGNERITLRVSDVVDRFRAVDDDHRPTVDL